MKGAINDRVIPENNAFLQNKRQQLLQIWKKIETTSARTFGLGVKIKARIQIM